MPEVRRGSIQVARAATSPLNDLVRPLGRENRTRSADDYRAALGNQPSTTSTTTTNAHTDTTRKPSDPNTKPDLGRASLSYAQRPIANVYYDSRAGTHKEYKRRAKTLQEYYVENPLLLPQLPFTWHHGKKRWRLFLFAFIAVVDACAIPIILYYALRYAGHVQGWIIFAVVTTIWGGPAYVEFAIRTLRLIKKERFYRPLNTTSRWSVDILTWISVLTIATVTALFIVGSAPHIVFLHVLSMPGPAILYCLGGPVFLLTMFHQFQWKAPFRISSTPKGGKVLPGAYYLIEDVVAVNARAGRPYREALAARYEASARFRRMLYVQSLFWSVPALLLAIALTVIAVVHTVPVTIAYGICWAVPFFWAILWSFISIRWCKAEMVKERVEWQLDEVETKPSSPKSDSTPVNDNSAV